MDPRSVCPTRSVRRLEPEAEGRAFSRRREVPEAFPRGLSEMSVPSRRPRGASRQESRRERIR